MPGAELLLVRGATVAIFVFLLSRTWADPDLWGHLRFGGDVVSAGQVAVRDGYTFTGTGFWVNPSWLADVSMYAAWTWGGTVGLVTAKLTVAAAIVAVTGWTLRRGGVRGPMLELWLLLCVAAIYPSVPTVRPQLLALLLFAVLVHVQASGSPRWAPRTVVVPVVMGLWVNLHGSWILGLVEVGIWSGAELLASKGSRRERLEIGAIALSALLATCVTPYGLALWAQLWSALGASLQEVSEWRSLLETRSPALVIWVVLMGLGVTVVAKHGAPSSQVLVLLWLAFASWRVSRLLPFFGLAAVGFLAPRFQMERRRPPAAAAPPAPARAVRLVLGVCSVVLVVACAVGTGRSMQCLWIDHTREADTQAAAFIARNRLRGRLLTYSDWGTYAIWHFAPTLQVSMDGRREFAYPSRELARHAAIYWNEPTARGEVEALAPDYIWLPRRLPVVPALESWGWSPIFTTERSVVLAQQSAAASTSWELPSSSVLPRCFPGDPVP